MIKISLGILLFILAIVLIISYKRNEEGFTDSAISSDINQSTPMPPASAAPLSVPAAPLSVPTAPLSVAPSASASPSASAAPSPVAPAAPTAPSVTGENGIARSPMIRTDENKNTIVLSQESIDSIALQLKSKILGDTQKSVKNSALVERQTTPVQSITESKAATSPSSQQGKEYDESKPCPAYPDGSCPPYPDMSKYIKKDSIPCWNCSIDY